MQSKTDQSCSAVPRASVYVDCEREAERFKWIESEKAGCDLGEQAVRRWVKEHWWGYLRARWLEHLQGGQFWEELDRGDFTKTRCYSIASSTVSKRAKKTSTSSSGRWIGASTFMMSAIFCKPWTSTAAG
jgi:hypothetical protein